MKQDNLNRKADELAKQHGFAKDKSAPSITGRSMWRKNLRHRERRLDTGTAEARADVPDEIIQQLIDRALQAGLSGELAQVWILSQWGLTNNEIADRLQLHRNTVSSRLREAKRALYQFIDSRESWFGVYLSECSRISYHSPSSIQTRVSPELRSARETIEEVGWETMILKDDQTATDTLRVRVTSPAGKEWLLTERQVTELAISGRVLLTTAQAGRKGVVLCR